MSRIVVDASMVMAWCFLDEAATDALGVLGMAEVEGVVVPWVWKYEVANAMLTAERRGRVDGPLAAKFLDTLELLDIREFDQSLSPRALWAAGRSHKLTSYDAAYLVTAQTLALPLATLDLTLAEAARQSGVEVVTAV
jgi:predicted nucleic acid-binding protein